MRAKTWIAISIVLALGAWMASGWLERQQAGAPSTPPVLQAEPEITDVQVRDIAAQDVMRYVELQGQAKANRTVAVRAETTGRVEELPKEKGSRVEAGDILARLAMNDREARLAEARAVVAQRESQYEAAERLGEKGYQATNQVKEAEAQLAAARASLAAIEEEIENTTVEAPFGSVLDALPVELGDYVAANGEVATLVDDDPLKVAGHVPQQKIRQIALGASAEVTFVTGDTVEGTVSFIASQADEQTRTFLAEVEVANEDGQFRPGMSAKVRIPVGAVTAHFVSPAVLSLDTDGQLGVKTVSNENLVAFHPVELVRSQPDGVWVTGLPADATVITVGQGFVTAGEKVQPVSGRQHPPIPAGPVEGIPSTAADDGTSPAG